MIIPVPVPTPPILPPRPVLPVYEGLDAWVDPNDGREAIYVRLPSYTCGIEYDMETNVMTLVLCEDTRE